MFTLTKQETLIALRALLDYRHPKQRGLAKKIVAAYPEWQRLLDSKLKHEAWAGEQDKKYREWLAERLTKIEVK